MNPTQNTQPITLDPSLVAASKALIQNESGGNFQASGKSGEYGAGQWMPDTWNAQAQKFLGYVPKFGDPTQMTPSIQKAVIYAQANEDKNVKGLNAAQFFAKWNSGSPDGWENKIGTNSKGVAYNVPQYVKNSMDLYGQFKQQGIGTDVADAATTQPDTQAPSGPSIGGFMNNTISSVGNLASGLVGAIAHPIKTVESLGNTAVGAVENASNLTGATQFNNTQTQTASNVGQYFAKRYGGSNPSEIAQNILNTAYKDPAGVALDLSTLLDGVGAGVGAVGDIADASKAAEVAAGSDFISTANGLVKSSSPEGIAALKTQGAISQTGKAIGNISDAINPINIAGKVVGGTANLGGKIIGNALGVGTGTGYDTINAGLKASQAGGDATQAFTAALRGNVSPEELVSQAKGALDEIVQKRRADYQSQLSKISDDTKSYDISPIIEELQNQMDKFKIGENSDGSLDFSRSTLRFNKPAQSDINTIYDEMKSFGTKQGDRTALGIDNLKQAFADLYTPSGQARSFIQSVTAKTREVLGQVPGYDKLTSDYANSTGIIDDIRKGLSLGDKVSVDTSFRKLTSALRQNNEFRKAVLQELDQVTNGQLLPKIAGQQMSSVAPRGLAKYGDELLGGNLLLHGTGFLPLMFSLAATSPRLVGEAVNALGFSSRISNKLIDLINSKIPLAKIPAIVNVGTQVNNSQGK